MSNKVKVINLTGISNNLYWNNIHEKLINKTLVVVCRSTAKVTRVDEVIFDKHGDTYFILEDEIYSSTVTAVAIGITKQLAFEV